MARKHITFLLIAAGGLSACGEGFEGTTAYRGPDSFIAIAEDRGRDDTASRNDCS